MSTTRNLIKEIYGDKKLKVSELLTLMSILIDEYIADNNKEKFLNNIKPIFNPILYRAMSEIKLNDIETTIEMSNGDLIATDFAYEIAQIKKELICIESYKKYVDETFPAPPQQKKSISSTSQTINAPASSLKERAKKFDVEPISIPNNSVNFSNSHLVSEPPVFDPGALALSPLITTLSFNADHELHDFDVYEDPETLNTVNLKATSNNTL